MICRVEYNPKYILNHLALTNISIPNNLTTFKVSIQPNPRLSFLIDSNLIFINIKESYLIW